MEKVPKQKLTLHELLQALGPGIMVACAAIGGSHLVWSTRAGAEFGWKLLGLVLLANLLKFPFFLYGQRYTAATGESLLAGYKRQGMVYVWIFLGINILTGVINIAGVGMLTGALISGYGLSGVAVPHLTVALLVVSAFLVLVGHYKFLDKISKVIICVLTISTVVAVLLAIPRQVAVAPDYVAPSPYTWAGFGFLVSLLGWMPAPIDLSAWSSLWMFSREKETGHFATVRESSVDFYLGYIAAVFLAVVFLALGALVMHGSGERFSASGIGFSRQLISLYTQSIGGWSHYLILTAAFFTMFSTTLTCLDGYPRSLSACCSLIGGLEPRRFDQIHRIWIIASTVLASVIVAFFVKNLIQLLSFAAIVSFLTSPILAFINYKVMSGENVPEHQRPRGLVQWISWAGLLFFVLMTIGFIYVKLFQ